MGEVNTGSIGKITIGFAALLLIVPLLIMTLGSGGTPKEEPPPVDPGGDNLNEAAIPDRKLIPWIKAANSTCTQISAPLIAAQLEAESNWNPRAVSPAGALGIAQFLPGTFAVYGRDDNHNGKKSPFDPPDAIMAQGRLLCQLADQLKGIPGDPLENILAGYNAGPNAVTRYNGIPPYAETLGYIKRIKALLPKYTADDPSGDGGNCGQPLLGNVTVGTPFGVYGPAWAWYGRHTGADYLGPMGAKIVAACDSTIVAIQSGGSYGNHVIVSLGQIDGHQVTMLYAHMSDFADIKIGQQVNAGTLLGYVGQTGNAFGPHLHLEVRRDFKNDGPFSQFVDPPKFIQDHAGPPADADNEEPADDTIAAVIKAARSQIGVPYSWGGGTVNGPSEGFAQGSGVVGFDCSSYVMYAWYQGTDGKITLPRTTYDQVDSSLLKTVPRKDIKPGDLIYFQTTSQGAGWSHVGLYIGDGKMLEEPRTGKSAQETDIRHGYYANQKQMVRRVITDRD